jgi:hypothetical protein
MDPGYPPDPFRGGGPTTDAPVAAPAYLWHSRPVLRASLHALPAALILLLGVQVASARTTERTSFADRSTGIQVYFPPGWTPQSRSSLPGILASFRHELGARIVLAAARRAESETASDQAERNRTQLRRLGWNVTPTTTLALGNLPGVLVVADDARGKQRLHQLYAASEKWVYVITFAAPPRTAAKLLKDLLYVARSARFQK